MKRPDEQLLDAIHREAIEAMGDAGVGDDNLPNRLLAVSVANAAVRTVVTDLRAMLSPEDYPGYDPDHMYWSKTWGQGEPFEWPAELPEWVATWADQILEELPDD